MLGAAPMSAVDAMGPDRERGGRSAVAAALEFMGQGPMRCGFRPRGGVRGPPVADAVAVAKPVPEGAGAAILRLLANVGHKLPFDASLSIWMGGGVTSIVRGAGVGGVLHPPPSASIRPTSDSN